MNMAILMGRLTRDPEVRYNDQNGSSMAIARYTLAVDRRIKQTDSSKDNADFISCVAFGKAGEFAEKYFRKGTKVVVTGRIQTGSYTNKDGIRVYTTDVIIKEQEFAESKNSGSSREERDNAVLQGAGYSAGGSSVSQNSDGFMNIPDGIEDDLPFN